MSGREHYPSCTKDGARFRNIRDCHNALEEMRKDLANGHLDLDMYKRQEDKISYRSPLEDVATYLRKRMGLLDHESDIFFDWIVPVLGDRSIFALNQVHAHIIFNTLSIKKDDPRREPIHKIYNRLLTQIQLEMDVSSNNIAIGT